MRWLSQSELGRPVLDLTGLKGNYTFALMWTPDTDLPGAIPDSSQGAKLAQPGAEGPSIFTAIQEQLGLKLEPKKGPVEIIEIARIEKPSAN